MEEDLSEREQEMLETIRNVRRKKELHKELRDIVRELIAFLSTEGHDGYHDVCSICIDVHDAEEVLDELAEL